MGGEKEGRVCMAMLKGNGYEVGVVVRDCEGKAVVAEDCEKVQVVIGGVERVWVAGGENAGIAWDAERGCFVVALSESETFAIREGVVKWQVRVKFLNGVVKGSLPKSEYVYESITERKLG